MEKQKNYCTECDQEIHGRKDKRFCSDQCRATNYNNQHADIMPFIRRINGVIKRNRKILVHLNSQGVTTVYRRQLIDCSFSFDYHTHTCKTASGRLCYFCYDQGYMELEDDFYVLVARGKENLYDKPIPSDVRKKMQQQLWPDQ